MSRFLERLGALAAPTPLVRRLSTQSVLSAVGDGVFLTGSAVFFTQVVGLSAAQVGLGLTISGVATFALAVPLGTLSDRYGAKPVWVVSSLVEALAYLLWLTVGGMASYVAGSIGLALVRTASRASRNASRIDVFPREQRVRSQSYFRAARNIGYTLGALLAGLALATNDDGVVRAVPVLTAVLLLLNALLISRLPAVAHHHVDQPLVKAVEGVVDEASPDRPPTTSALRNRGYVLACALDGVLGTHQVLLNVVIPLWLVEETDAPRVLLAWLFGTNTVMAVLLQVAAARGVTTVQESLRAQYRGAACFVLSCGIVLVTHDTTGWITIVLVWVGHVTVTGSELFQSAGMWGLVAELSAPERLGDYQGVSSLGYTLGEVWAPALYTFLAMSLGAPGWIIIALIVVAAAVAIGPASHAAERYLTRESAPPAA